MPKINLLPKERAAASKKRRGLAVGLFLGLAYAAILVLVFLSVQARETSAEEELADQQRANQLIQAEVDTLEPYAQLRRDYEDGVMRLQEALALDVAWGRLLSDFGRMIGDKRVWLTALDVQMMAPEEPEGEDAEPIVPVFGAISMGGEGFEYSDVASWLVTLDSQDWEDVGAAWASTVTANEGDVPTVSWSITSVLSERALTDRIETLIPEVPE